jgi:hypothetical protein
MGIKQMIVRSITRFCKYVHELGSFNKYSDARMLIGRHLRQAGGLRIIFKRRRVSGVHAVLTLISGSEVRPE